MALKSFSPAQPSGRTGRGSAISTFAILVVVMVMVVVGEARLGEKKFGFGAALAVALVYRTLILAHRLNPSRNGHPRTCPDTLVLAHGPASDIRLTSLFGVFSCMSYYPSL